MGVNPEAEKITLNSNHAFLVLCNGFISANNLDGIASSKKNAMKSKG
jgi:hypothetical protein